VRTDIAAITSRIEARRIDTRRSTGIKGEEEAARFLSRCGYAILDKNVRTRAGEIDLVARLGKTVVFVEVKTLKEIVPFPPQAGVTTRKQNKLGRLAQGYLRSKKLREVPCRFDVISVIVNDDGGVKAIRHFPNAFSVAPW
jgi:putative endonuclease